NNNYVSCTIFDINGNITAISKKFPKMSFLENNNLYPRDLRNIDTSAVDIVPSIVIRKNCILINLLYIKAIIQKNQVMIFDISPTNQSSISKLGLFMYDLEDLNKNYHQNYEFRVLETILINIMSSLETELNNHLKVSSSILKDLENQIDRIKLKNLLINSKSLTAYYQKSLLIREVLDELLENDEDLQKMYLSDNNNPNMANSNENFTEIEMLIESYYKQCDEFVQQAGSLISDIKSTEEIVNIILDANRNSLMLYELKLTIYTLGFTVATTIPAFYGMNLKNFIEDSIYGFSSVVGISILSAIGIVAISFNKLRTVQKLTMMLG
ncbi:Mrs2p, partial [Ascoidea rubescens DSM 1968]